MAIYIPLFSGGPALDTETGEAVDVIESIADSGMFTFPALSGDWVTKILGFTIPDDDADEDPDDEERSHQEWRELNE